MASEDANAQYQYMGSYVPSPTYPHVSAVACSFRLPPPPTAVASCRVPPLRCSFPSLLHPHYELVKGQCDAWLLGFVRPPSPAARRLLLDGLIPRMVCRNIPTARSLPRLIQVAKMITWLIVSDDEVDLPDALGADVAATSQRAAQIMAILRCQDSPLPSSAKCRMDNGEEDAPSFEAGSRRSSVVIRALEALAQLWEDMCTEMPSNLRTRFISTMADYFDGVQKQVAYRRAHRLPDMEAFMEIRRQSSFILGCFCLVEYAMGIELEEDAYANPQVQKFRNTALDYMCLCNDILSCRVEMGVGDYFNMPSIVYSMHPNNETLATFQDAINFVARMIGDLDAKLVSMVASINQSSLPSLQSPSLKTYITALCYCMSGCLAWYPESARYQSP